MNEAERIEAERAAVAHLGEASFAVTLTPTTLASGLEAQMWLSSGGHLQLRDSVGHLVAEVSASSVTLSSLAPQYEPGTGPLGVCNTVWHMTIDHQHECRHTYGHARVGDLPHECGCGARLPI